MSVSWDEEILYVEIPAQGVPTVDVLSTPLQIEIPASGLQGPAGPTGASGTNGANGYSPPIYFARKGTCEVLTGGLKYMMMDNATLTSVVATMGENGAPIGDDLIFDIKINGIATESVTIPDGATTISPVPLNWPVNVGDYVTVDITQVGSTEPGSNLSVFIKYEI